MAVPCCKPSQRAKTDSLLLHLPRLRRAAFPQMDGRAPAPKWANRGVQQALDPVHLAGPPQDAHSLQTQARPPPHPAAVQPGTLPGLAVPAGHSPVRLGEQELGPISCHGGRVSGVGGQLCRGPLRVRKIGLDEGNVVQQGGVGRAENLLSHLLCSVRCHLQVREERGARSGGAQCFRTSRLPNPNSNPSPAPQPCAPQSLWGTHKAGIGEAQGPTSVWGMGKCLN